MADDRGVDNLLCSELAVPNPWDWFECREKQHDYLADNCPLETAVRKSAFSGLRLLPRAYHLAVSASGLL